MFCAIRYISTYFFGFYYSKSIPCFNHPVFSQPKNKNRNGLVLAQRFYEPVVEPVGPVYVAPSAFVASVLRSHGVRPECRAMVHILIHSPEIGEICVPPFHDVKGHFLVVVLWFAAVNANLPVLTTPFFHNLKTSNAVDCW